MMVVDNPYYSDCEGAYETASECDRYASLNKTRKLMKAVHTPK